MVLGGALLFALFVLVRCLYLDADPPLRIGPHDARELFAEPPAKSHEARNHALFGTFHVNPADDYQFWRVQSPLWVYPLARFFEAFGTSYPTLRVFSTLYAALGLLALMAMAAHFLTERALWFLGLVLVTDSVFFHTSRVGFLEPAVASYSSVAVLCLLLAVHRHIGFLVGAHGAFAAALLTKQAAVVVLPVIVVGTVWALARSPNQDHRTRLWRSLVVAHLVILSSLIAWYVTRDAYYRSVVHNVGHVLLGSDAGRAARWRGVGSLGTRLTDTARYQHFLLSVPVTGPLALLTVAAGMLDLARGRRPSALLWLCSLWFLCALGSMMIVAKSALRFWTVVVPPSALVAAAGLEAALGALERRGVRRAQVALALLWLALLSLNSYGYVRHVWHPRYTVRDGAAALSRHLGKRDASLIGLVAPGLVLATPYKNYYVRGSFNNGATKLASLGITHMLVLTRDPATQIATRAFPGLLRGVRPVLKLTVRGQRLRLFDVHDRWTEGH